VIVRLSVVKKNREVGLRTDAGHARVRKIGVIAHVERGAQEKQLETELKWSKERCPGEMEAISGGWLSERSALSFLFSIARFARRREMKNKPC
jgi:hypothetical protein